VLIKVGGFVLSGEEMEKYELVKDIGAGKFGVSRQRNLDSLFGSVLLQIQRWM